MVSPGRGDRPKVVRDFACGLRSYSILPAYCCVKRLASTRIAVQFLQIAIMFWVCRPEEWGKYQARSERREQGRGSTHLWQT